MRIDDTPKWADSDVRRPTFLAFTGYDCLRNTLEQIPTPFDNSPHIHLQIGLEARGGTDVDVADALRRIAPVALVRTHDVE